MREWRFMRLLPALLLALGVAFAPPAFAQGKAGAPKAGAAEARSGDSRQAALLQRQISALAPQTKGVTDIYTIGIAGWTQDVFRNELAGALRITGKALPLNGGTVRLINSRETADTVPLASLQNFAAAVRAVARVMDKEEDVLFLFMTSHGEKRSFGLQLPSAIVRLRPSEVAAVLNREGIKNRVVIVSACYSGIFVKPLANANSIVLTAADEKSTSFGCAEGREWTYFGDALFQHSLKPGTDFRAAFAKALGLIAEWEKRDRFASSNPQGHFGEALVRKLAPLVKATGRADK
ncbi:MAG TPA: C13 family peptidase [Xanthobacteraceae bacterium]|nr:C13 family peptidase [Xanthobacteraceae bacterium]